MPRWSWIACSRVFQLKVQQCVVSVWACDRSLAWLWWRPAETRHVIKGNENDGVPNSERVVRGAAEEYIDRIWLRYCWHANTTSPGKLDVAHHVASNAKCVSDLERLTRDESHQWETQCTRSCMCMRVSLVLPESSAAGINCADRYSTAILKYQSPR